MRRSTWLRAALAVGALSLGAYGFLAVRPTPLSADQMRSERANTPPGFVYVPGGSFVVGSDDPDADDEARPARRVYLPSFYMGRTEVSHAEWKRFRPAHQIPDGLAKHPMTHITLEEARAYCAFVGGRLPTDREWEKAARGSDGRRYPWGDVLDAKLANIRERRSRAASNSRSVAATQSGGAECVVGPSKLLPVTAFPEGASPYGALNMAGNAWEWVEDAFHGDPQKRIIRGGAAGYWERDARTYHRGIEGAGVT
ncbi:MAG: formylglycine-generating enzyme family protein [Actinomycetota bacterium]